MRSTGWVVTYNKQIPTGHYCYPETPQLVTNAAAAAPPCSASSHINATAPLPSTSTASGPPLITSATVDSPSTNITDTVAAALPSTSTDADPSVTMDQGLLLMLGDDPSQTKAYGKDIHPELAVRLEHIATIRLSKETRKELLDKYMLPENCKLIDAPALNPEIKAATTEIIVKRDKAIEQRQKQIASATSCVAEALTLLFSSEPKNTTLIQLLMDASKLLCDSQNSDSTMRRGFILNNLKKELRSELQQTKIDKLLFSEGLADTIKTAKAIVKTGAEMKSTPTQKFINKNTNKQPPKNLNWWAPPQNL